MIFVKKEYMKQIILILVAFALSVQAFSKEQESDVFVPIEKYIRLGDHESLAVWFANNLELDIMGNINDCSKLQATQIIKDFFITYKPSDFTIIHKSGKAPMKYAIGNLKAGGESFRVTLFVKIQPGGNQIQQLRIERDSRL